MTVTIFVETLLIFPAKLQITRSLFLGNQVLKNSLHKNILWTGLGEKYQKNK